METVFDILACVWGVAYLVAIVGFFLTGIISSFGGWQR